MPLAEYDSKYRQMSENRNVSDVNHHRSSCHKKVPSPFRRISFLQINRRRDYTSKITIWLLKRHIYRPLNFLSRNRLTFFLSVYTNNKHFCINFLFRDSNFLHKSTTKSSITDIFSKAKIVLLDYASIIGAPNNESLRISSLKIM